MTRANRWIGGAVRALVAGVALAVGGSAVGQEAAGERPSASGQAAPASQGQTANPLDTASVRLRLPFETGPNLVSLEGRLHKEGLDLRIMPSGSRGIILYGTLQQIPKAIAVVEDWSDEVEAASGAVTFDFEGGSVYDYLERIAKEAKFEGFVYQDEALLRSLRAPPAKLRGSAVSTAVGLLTAMDLATEAGATCRLDVNWIGPAAGKGSVSGAPLRESVCVISGKLDRGAGTAIHRAVFDLSGLPTGSDQEVQTLLEAATLAVEFDGGSPTFAAKYHPPSHMLFVKGSEDELSAIREVLRLRLPDMKSTTPAGQATTTITTSTTPPDSIPGPFTDQEIAAMSKAEAQATLGLISRARQVPGLGREVQERLKSDFQRVLKQAKDAN